MPDYRTQIGHTHLKMHNVMQSVDFHTRYPDLKDFEQVTNGLPLPLDDAIVAVVLEVA